MSPQCRTKPRKTPAVTFDRVLMKKAELCVTVAKLLLRGRRFDLRSIESQAAALMHMPERELKSTHRRLASIGRLRIVALKRSKPKQKKSKPQPKR